LNYRLIADEGPTVASVTTYLLPVVAVALGYAVLREPVGLSVVGMLTILAGVYLVQRRNTLNITGAEQSLKGPTSSIDNAIVMINPKGSPLDKSMPDSR
jgi:hypothetical protein